uniref:Uncharacterized protein n=1 Tax=Opuntia streptacantha TaxID=393608 RepID=A0A7C8ZJI0_OPUST
MIHVQTCIHCSVNCQRTDLAVVAFRHQERRWFECHCTHSTSLPQRRLPSVRNVRPPHCIVAQLSLQHGHRNGSPKTPITGNLRPTKTFNPLPTTTIYPPSHLH